MEPDTATASNPPMFGGLGSLDVDSTLPHREEDSGWLSSLNPLATIYLQDTRQNAKAKHLEKSKSQNYPPSHLDHQSFHSPCPAALGLGSADAPWSRRNGAREETIKTLNITNESRMINKESRKNTILYSRFTILPEISSWWKWMAWPSLMTCFLYEQGAFHFHSSQVFGRV